MTAPQAPLPVAPAAPALQIETSRHFLEWLAQQRISIALTTYQIGKLFLLGLRADDKLSVFERSFSRCMGLCEAPGGFYMSSKFQVWRFVDVLRGAENEGHDRLYVPQVGWTTGDLDIHDMAIDGDGRLVFVNTLFSCLGRLSETHSFRPVWRPRFISRLAAEDRCHLNGLAMRDGRAAFVTSVHVSDMVDGWREHRTDGGVLIDVESGEIACCGLGMPHSPRWHRGKVWLHNSATGEFGSVDLAAGRFEPIAFCPGYARGLAFVGDFALVGLSLARGGQTFEGLPLQERLAARATDSRCGLLVIDLRTGDAVHWLRFMGLVEELYDVIALPGVRSPMALGFRTEEIERTVSIEE